MLTLKQIYFACAFTFALLSTVIAQDSPRPTTQSSSLTITAAASGERVRITAPSSVVQMHVEVYAASGEKLFDQEIRGGNVFDWHLQDGQAQRVAPGDYVCVVTVKSISGKLTQKIGTVSVAEKSASVLPAESKQLSAPQAQTIGPVEEDSSWMIAGKAEPQTGTVIAHDGIDGQMIRGRGALTFRIGNFFSGIDTEQMRLTEDGRLGIGTSNPQAKLDVAGTIRAERFLVAKPRLAGVDKTDALAAADATGSVQPLASGTGTQDRIAKWTDNAGTLGDSVITELAGNVGIGTPTPSQALEVANGRITITGSQTSAVPGGLLEIGTTLTNNNNQASGIRMRNTFNGNATNQVALDVAPTFAPSANISLARGFISAAFFAPPPGVTITDALGGVAANVYNNTGGAVTNGTGFALNSPVVFGPLKPTTQYGLRINNQGIAGTTNSYGLFVDAQSGSTKSYSAIFAGGNVGIGTTAPGSRLEINDPANTGLRVANLSTGGRVASFGANGTFEIDSPGLPGGRFLVRENGNVLIGLIGVATSSHLNVAVPSSPNPISAINIDVESFQTPGNAIASHFFRASDIGSGLPSAFLIRGDGNVGIGTDAPNAKLQVNNGDVYLATPGNGIILRSPNGSFCRRLTVDDAQNLASTPITCPGN